MPYNRFMLMRVPAGLRGRFAFTVAVLMATAAGLAGTAASARAQAAAAPAWQPLFDGKTLGNWQSTKFIGEGPVKVQDGQIVLNTGGPMTGITWAGPKLPTANYEIAFQAMRIEGEDFFAGITFPVADSFCSLILGGWGGTVVGLSNINGMDASENETSQSITFEPRRWYNVRIRVTAARIEAWLDDRQIVNQDLAGKKIDTRIEVEPSKPLGIASYRTAAALREIRLRPIP
jgi:hypothetical protein